MHSAYYAVRLLAFAALVLPLALAESAHAQNREFAGRVVSITAQAIEVKDRRGDKVTFGREQQTAVEGKDTWEAIAPGDEVIVRWKMGDGTARRVIVLESGGKH